MTPPTLMCTLAAVGGHNAWGKNKSQSNARINHKVRRPRVGLVKLFMA
jgi:hypothetical protein